MTSITVGSHINITDDILKGIKEIQNAGGNIVQIFVTNEDNKLDNIKEYITNNNIKLVIHSSYLTNIARVWDKYSWQIRNLIVEMEYAKQAGAFGVVVHLGEALDLPENLAINNMFTSITHVISETDDTMLLIETGAGQGSQLCYQLDDLAKFYKKFSILEPKKRDRIKICLDTCHLFAAGHDLTTVKKVDQFWNQLDLKIGITNIALIHLNDSSKPIGSRVDRHASLGKGEIGSTGLNQFFYHGVKHHIPILLETPHRTYGVEISGLIALADMYKLD